MIVLLAVWVYRPIVHTAARVHVWFDVGFYRPFGIPLCGSRLVRYFVSEVHTTVWVHRCFVSRLRGAYRCAGPPTFRSPVSRFDVHADVRIHVVSCSVPSCMPMFGSTSGHWCVRPPHLGPWDACSCGITHGSLVPIQARPMCLSMAGSSQRAFWLLRQCTGPYVVTGRCLRILTNAVLFGSLWPCTPSVFSADTVR